MPSPVLGLQPHKPCGFRSLRENRAAIEAPARALLLGLPGGLQGMLHPGICSILCLPYASAGHPTPPPSCSNLSTAVLPPRGALPQVHLGTRGRLRRTRRGSAASPHQPSGAWKRHRLTPHAGAGPAPHGPWPLTDTMSPVAAPHPAAHRRQHARASAGLPARSLWQRTGRPARPFWSAPRRPPWVSPSSPVQLCGHTGRLPCPGGRKRVDDKKKGALKYLSVGE